MANPNVLELTTANWEQEVVKSDKPVLVDFWATWCGPCRQLIPTMDKLAEQFAGKAKIGKLNTDDNHEIAIKYGVSSLPVILVFGGNSDQPCERSVGVRSEQEYAKIINRALGMP